LQEAQAIQTKYAGDKQVVFKVADKVWLSTMHFRTTRSSKKLDYKRTGPYTVSKVTNMTAYKLDLPYMIRKHNVVHVSFLTRYAAPSTGQPPSEQQPTVVNDFDEWEVNQILDSTRCYRKLQYFIKWVGYSYVQTHWEPAENLGKAPEFVNQFHQEHPRKHQQGLDLEERDWTFSTRILLCLLSY
jgi:hypothetical protein